MERIVFQEHCNEQKKNGSKNGKDWVEVGLIGVCIMVLE